MLQIPSVVLQLLSIESCAEPDLEPIVEDPDKYYEGNTF